MIEAVTTSHIIVGRAASASGSVRLVDLLNQREMLVLTECRVYALESIEVPVAIGMTCSVGTERIVWARPIERAQDGDSPDPLARAEHVEKRPCKVSVLAPPFRIAGLVHIPEAADHSFVVTRFAKGFLPVTGVQVVIGGEGGSIRDFDFIVLNGRLADVICMGQMAESAGGERDRSLAA